VKRSLAVIVVLAAVLADLAGAATTRIDQHGTVLVDGRKVFPIVLAKGPEPGMTTPAGADGLSVVVDAGVNFLKTGPATRPWWPEDIADAVEYNRAAAERGVYTWVNLATLSDARPDTLKEERLREVISTLEGDASASALGFWKGADEPWWGDRQPSALQFAYCLGTTRGEATWCEGKTPADEEHLWVTIQAPRGTADDLRPYTAVTDIHGVDHYPVTFANPDPDLHEIGTWTQTIASITPSGAVWTTLQVCASGSSDPDGSGDFVVPTPRQERYMIYDAILNGATSLAFYGGNINRCWNESDTARSWNWTFWDAVLEDSIREIAADSPIAPALVNPGTTMRLSANDATTQAISRRGATEDELWVIAARHGAGSEQVTISGLPAAVQTGTVYTEDRSVEVRDGSFTDTFERWDVHVYRFQVPPPPPPAPPPPPPPPPAAQPTTLKPAAARPVARCRVPNVRRKTLRAARVAIRRAGCTVGRVRAVRSARFRKGRVIRQGVRAGARVRRGSRVALVVSRGRR
jgi:hypothetical protein